MEFGQFIFQCVYFSSLLIEFKKKVKIKIFEEFLE